MLDSYADGAGSTEGRLLGRFTLFDGHDANTARASAGRAAAEIVGFAPTSALPQCGVEWRADSDDAIVARLDLPPERPEVHARIDEHGALRAVSVLRWGDADNKAFDYVPFGCEMHAERRFGDVTIPSRLSAGWWFDTPRYAPFFKAGIHHVERWDVTSDPTQARRG